MATPDELQALLANVTKTVTLNSQSNDPEAYDDALAAIQKLQLAVEKPGDFAARIRFQSLQNTALVMLAEMGVLQAIVATPGQDITSATLAQDSNCDENLILRLMRTLTAAGVCDETGVHTYRSNAMTEVLASSGQRAGMQFMVDLQFHIGSRIRDYMRETGFHKKGTSSLTACQFAFGKSFWRILDENAEERANFNEYMKAARRGGQVQLWHERYPPVKALAGETQLKTGAEDVLMVSFDDIAVLVSEHHADYTSQTGRCRRRCRRPSRRSTKAIPRPTRPLRLARPARHYQEQSSTSRRREIHGIRLLHSPANQGRTNLLVPQRVS